MLSRKGIHSFRVIMRRCTYPFVYRTILQCRLSGLHKFRTVKKNDIDFRASFISFLVVLFGENIRHFLLVDQQFNC